MRNTIRKSIYALAISATLTGCADDFLTQEVKGTQTLDNYFNNPEECMAQVIGCYQAIAYGEWWQIYNAYILTDMCTDDEWMGNTTQSPEDYIDLVLYQGKTTSIPMSNFWQFRYKGIHRCNVVLHYLPSIKNIKPEVATRMEAEVRYLRAYFYFELINFFGGVPLILDMEATEKNVNRTPVDECYAQIEQDLKFAAENLPTRSVTVKEKELGRATSGAALSLLGKAYLFQEKYQKASETLGKVIASGEYSLLPDFKNVWSIDYNNSTESIFEIQTNNDVTLPVGQRISVIAGSRDDSGWSWGNPTSDLENAFSEAGDDIRLESTIIRNGALSIPNETATIYASNQEPLFPYLISPEKHKSARVNAKLYIPQQMRPVPYDENHNPLNYRLMRYADVLLMAAEALNQTGDDAQARQYLNQVRSRVKLPATSSTGQKLQDEIRLERRLELALEGKRLFDIRRWKDSNGKPAICNIMGPNGSWVRYNLHESTDPYETSNLKEPQNEGYDFQEPRDLLFPIPNTEIVQSNGSLEQNPGYEN